MCIRDRRRVHGLAKKKNTQCSAELQVIQYKKRHDLNPLLFQNQKKAFKESPADSKEHSTKPFRTSPQEDDLEKVRFNLHHTIQQLSQQERCTILSCLPC
eukprot:TRINITY_DN58478_c0_g1_i1.p1 TRINITY_DN58478_c0_g1~~TRINITY_DN58478_c0_g1_i1.p1  ORF type:complete len:100 (+),score=15.24 TRINITY_DN58478_c0_g1_i1:165-464(+)